MSDQKTRVLVSAASKHGSTGEIAERIAASLTGRGIEVTFTRPGDSRHPEEFHGLVLGSAVYAGHWLGEARELAERVASASPRPEVWLFSSGPIGDPPKPDEDPVDVAAITEMTRAREHRLFAGKLEKDQLGFGEKAIVAALRAPEGDFRDWDAIETWAGEIADALQASEISS